MSTSADQPSSGPEAPRPSHPLFDRITNMPRGVVEQVAERRIHEGRAAGLFDDLPGHGKPIPDLDQKRPSGWWAKRFVDTERHAAAREDLLGGLQRAMPAIWRLDSVDEVEAQLAWLNAQIAEHNRVTTVEPIESVDLSTTLATWRRLNAQ